MGFRLCKNSIRQTAFVLAAFLLVWGGGLTVMTFKGRLFCELDCPAVQAGIRRPVLTVKKVRYVWFEVNSELYVDGFLAHAGQWEKAGRLIVTTRLYNSEAIIKRLTHAGLNVTGGFKTSDAFHDVPFHDEKAWERIASTARRMADLTKGKPVIIENEGSVTMMVKNGVTSVDSDKLLASIAKQQWPNIWFWYAPMGKSKPYETLSFAIAEAVKKGIPQSRLIEASSAGYPGSLKDKRSQYNLGLTLKLDSHPVSIIYLDDQIPHFWRLRDAIKAVKQAFSNTVILYPGFGDIANSRPVIDSLSEE